MQLDSQRFPAANWAGRQAHTIALVRPTSGSRWVCFKVYMLAGMPGHRCWPWSLGARDLWTTTDAVQCSAVDITSDGSSSWSTIIGMHGRFKRRRGRTENLCTCMCSHGYVQVRATHSSIMATIDCWTKSPGAYLYLFVGRI